MRTLFIALCLVLLVYPAFSFDICLSEAQVKQITPKGSHLFWIWDQQRKDFCWRAILPQDRVLPNKKAPKPKLGG